MDRLFNILLKDITEEEVRHVIVGLIDFGRDQFGSLLILQQKI